MVIERKKKVQVNFPLQGEQLELIYDMCDLGFANTPADFVKKALSNYLVELMKSDSIVERQKKLHELLGKNTENNQL